MASMFSAVSPAAHVARHGCAGERDEGWDYAMNASRASTWELLPCGKEVASVRFAVYDDPHDVQREQRLLHVIINLAAVCRSAAGGEANRTARVRTPGRGRRGTYIHPLGIAL